MLKNVFAVLAIVLLTACAAAPQKAATGATAPAAAQAPAVAQTPEAALRARAAAYYAALVAGQYETAYGFFAPGYRATWSASAHYQIHPPAGKYLSADVLSVKCLSETVCDVVVAARFRFNAGEALIGGTEVPMDVRDRWLSVDGVWYFVPPP